MEPETTCTSNDTTEKRKFYMAMELSQKEWKLGFSVGPGQAPRLRSVPGRDLGGLVAEIQLARERFGLGKEVEVESYEAGRDGFWLHRYLERQGVRNLVDNALHYTPEGGRVLLSAQVVNEMLEIRVQDSGPGIVEDELDRIFDRFYRSDPSRQRDEGGSGLGLAIARAIVEKHNGRIWAESELWEGTTIVIRLPIHNEKL